ncbi:MAG: hypothetical protein D6687_03870 [Acidobacteria bacterium]|nr:MAG: hypothetical protein D6687_03870 [Acidobacteriota bacterium]
MYGLFQRKSTRQLRRTWCFLIRRNSTVASEEVDRLVQDQLYQLPQKATATIVPITSSTVKLI